MSDAEQLLQLAMRGADACATWNPDFPGSFAPLRPVLTEGEKHRRLLAQASALCLWQQVGKKPLPAPTPPLSPAETEDLPVVNASAASCLRRILSGYCPGWLADWLKLAGRCGEIAPAELLPELLTAIAKEKSLIDISKPVIGKRGIWLANLNPNWAFPDDSDNIWENGTLKERQLFFQRLRRQNSTTARDLLEAVWSSESASVRSGWLRLMEDNLTAADEPFLEKRLDDKSKEVRSIAADLLACLPESTLRYRIQSRLLGMIQFTPVKLLRHANIAIALPGEFDAAAIRDGIDLRTTSKMGAKAVALMRMISVIPPSFWINHFQAPAETLWQAAEKSEWAEALHSGWAWAASRHQDADWAEMILRRGFFPDACPYPCAQIARALPYERRASILTHLCRSGKLGLNVESPAGSSGFSLLYEFDSTWPDQLADMVFESYFAALLNKTLNWRIYQTAVTFTRFYSLDFCRHVLGKWQPSAEMPKHAQEWRESIAFRAELLESFAENSGYAMQI